MHYIADTVFYLHKAVENQINAWHNQYYTTDFISPSLPQVQSSASYTPHKGSFIHRRPCHFPDVVLDVDVLLIATANTITDLQRGPVLRPSRR
jgi:hypothetical protein